jgi:hypothetical protein
LCFFIETMRPFLFIIKSIRVKPPLVL